MPANGYSVGRDVAVDIIAPSGLPLRLRVRTGFSSKQETNDIKVKRADGGVDHLVIPDGWTGSLDYERGSSDLDDYFAALESTYFAGGSYGPTSITETITNPDSSISQYRYTNVALKYDDAGAKTGDNTIKQKVTWMASRRIRIV